MTEKELIEGVIARERTAVAFLVETYQKSIIKTAYYFLGNLEDAEDLAQDIFLEILNSMKKFRQNSALSTWIYRITVNSSLNALKKKKRGEFFHQMGNLFKADDGSNKKQFDAYVTAESSLDEEENRRLLNNAIGSLPENQRTAFVLNKYEELSCKEVSEVMGMSVSSVESLLHRAKMNLQKDLVKHFSEYSKK